VQSRLLIEGLESSDESPSDTDDDDNEE